VNRPRLLAVDLLAAGGIPFLGIWLYELSNWIVLAPQGYAVTFSMAGWLPVGVAVVSSGGVSLLTKALQMVIATSLVLPLCFLFSRKGLVVARTLAVSTVGVYIASAYWEMLSALEAQSMALHTFVFVAGVSVMSLAVLKMTEHPRHPINVLSRLF